MIHHEAPHHHPGDHVDHDHEEAHHHHVHHHQHVHDHDHDHHHIHGGGGSAGAETTNNNNNNNILVYQIAATVPHIMHAGVAGAGHHDNHHYHGGLRGGAPGCGGESGESALYISNNDNNNNDDNNNNNNNNNNHNNVSSSLISTPATPTSQAKENGMRISCAAAAAVHGALEEGASLSHYSIFSQREWDQRWFIVLVQEQPLRCNQSQPGTRAHVQHPQS